MTEALGPVFFGNRLGDWVLILATTLAGAYAVVTGLMRMFPAAVGVTATYSSPMIPLHRTSICRLSDGLGHRGAGPTPDPGNTRSFCQSLT